MLIKILFIKFYERIVFTSIFVDNDLRIVKSKKERGYLPKVNFKEGIIIKIQHY